MAGCAGTAGGTRPSDYASPPTSPSSSPAATAGPELTATGLVLQNEAGAAELCLGGVNESYPPQCGGPAIVGWNWAAVEGEESAAGTTWGEYEVWGTWDGESFTPTRQSIPIDRDEPGQAVPATNPLATRCTPPAGGWVPVDPATTTATAISAARARAESLAGYTAAWPDSSPWPDEVPSEEKPVDPTHVVFNVLSTGDPSEVERAMREVWGGALCIEQTEHSETELLAVTKLLGDSPPEGLLSWGPVRDTIEASVFYDDGSIQQVLDEDYGVGVITVTSRLVPA